MPATSLRASSPRRIGSASAVDWQQSLPEKWRTSVVEALDFTEYREYEIPACRTLGHDENGELCFYAHRYTLTESRSDDDEDFYEVVAYSETVRAWRLRDARWLTWRIVQTGDDAIPGRGFYSFSEHAPR